MLPLRSSRSTSLICRQEGLVGHIDRSRDPTVGPPDRSIQAFLGPVPAPTRTRAPDTAPPGLRPALRPPAGWPRLPVFRLPGWHSQRKLKSSDPSTGHAGILTSVG